MNDGFLEDELCIRWIRILADCKLGSTGEIKKIEAVIGSQRWARTIGEERTGNWAYHYVYRGKFGFSNFPGSSTTAMTPIKVSEFLSPLEVLASVDSDE